MHLSPLVYRALWAVGAVIMLGVLRYLPWRSNVVGDPGTVGTGVAAASREHLTVGFLPVT